MSTDSPTPILELQAFVCRRGGDEVFAPADLVLQAGEILWLTGANGAGKTSFLRGLIGLVEHSCERFAFCGKPLPAARAELLEHCNWIGHEAAMKSEFSIAENLTLDCQQRGRELSQSVEYALAAVGLPELADFPAGTLSAGQRRRAALARLLLRPARLWLLDEPLANLDQASSALLAEVMANFVAQGGALILTGHGQLPSRLQVRELHLEAPAWS
ncbi:MAG: heme ABC exporter ATP-binding protein CcmA [Xanthomonadales bacterium]|nr:heme ABC exporter ATP-binding protein CcmA [Xanthomonadales bacterium]